MEERREIMTDLCLSMQEICKMLCDVDVLK